MNAPRDPLRILTLCYEFPPVGGGGGAVAKTVAERLAARGHHVRVVTAGMAHLPRREQCGDIEVFRTRSCRRREDRCTVPEMAAFLAAAFFPTLRQVREWVPDVIHAHFAVPTGVLAFAASLSRGIPYVLTVHLGDVPGGFPEQTAALFRVIKPLTVPVWKRAAAISAVSEHVRDLASAAYHLPVETILNGVPAIRSANQSVAIHDPVHFVFAGRFVSQKNLPVLVEALMQIRTLRWRATLIGDGPMMETLSSQIRDAGLEDRIALPRWQERSAVDQTMAVADVFLIPSSAEGLPMAAVQALAHGLAIVGSDIGGLRDVIVDRVNGFVAPVGDAAALAQKLQRLVEDRALLLQMKQASRDRAQLFDLDRITTQYENLLRRVAAGRHAAIRHVD